MQVLITGTAGKFVTLFEKYIKEQYADISVTKLSVRGDDWKRTDFNQYDVLIHCAGITQSKENGYDEFEAVNVIKTGELCECVKDSRIRQFIYLGSMSVYDGLHWGFGENGIVRETTEPVPGSYYGKSKLEAEKQIFKILGDTGIKVSILRAPAIVGKGMEAYFNRYIGMSGKVFFPIPKLHMEAKRSFVYVDTLIAFMVMVMRQEKEGVFYPQNLPLLSVSEMYAEICRLRGGKRIKGSWVYKLLPLRLQERFFGQICYDEMLSQTENQSIGSISSYEALKKVLQEEGIIK